MSVNSVPNSSSHDPQRAFVWFHRELSRIARAPRPVVVGAGEVLPAMRQIDRLGADLRALMWSESGRTLDDSLSPIAEWRAGSPHDPLYRLFDLLGELVDGRIPRSQDTFASIDIFSGEKPAPRSIERFMAICCVQGFVREIYDCLEAAVALADGIAAGARTHGVVSAVSCETRARLDS